MASSIHVLCSNFTKIVCREAGERMHCFVDKEVYKMRVFGAILRPFNRGCQTFAEERAM